MTQDTVRAEFDVMWHSMPLPAEYNSMDDCDRWRWKNVAWIVWNSAVAATRERDAKRIEKLRDGHCANTAHGLDPCAPDSAGCDFVQAWNDAIDIIRSQL